MRAARYRTNARRSKRIAIRIAAHNFEREFALPPALAYALFGLAPLLIVLCLGVGSYQMFHDDMLAALMRRESRMQYAYEDRIAALRAQVDSLASSQMRARDKFEGKVAALALRQARLESRSALIAALAAKVSPKAAFPPAAAAESAESAPAARESSQSFAQDSAKVDAPAKLSAKKTPPPDSNKPAPDGFDLRVSETPDGPRSAPASPPPGDVSENDNPVSPSQRLRNIADNFDLIEKRQIATLDRLRVPAATKAEKLRRAFEEADLPIKRMIRHAESLHAGKAVKEEDGVGGPFEPAPASADGGDFDRAYASLNQDVKDIDGLRLALPFAPLRQPLAGKLFVNSPFGERIDPFNGRLAMHPGVDLRAEYGEPIHATAAGRVTIAGPDGGYGNMVQIDHGAGLATRYGHMSHIDVAVGQWVEAGQVIGRVGSTGRSTGPHLHYEVRVDGTPVDPTRYLKAGRILSASL